MSAAYNQVPRLSTGPKMMGHHPHDQMQHDGGTQQPFAADHPNAKQRKWRVLVSIGLLLPALAAIIGIVAWTISIEVTNGNQQGPVSMAQRRTERAQMEQFRRDEALALAALVAARRSARQSHTLAATGSAPHSHQNQKQASAESASVPLAEAIVAQPNLPKAQRPMPPTTRPTRSNPQQQQQQAISSNKQPEHQMSKNSGEASSIISKNREQAESVIDDSAENQGPTASASLRAASLGEDGEFAASKQVEQGARSEPPESPSGSEVSREADDSATRPNLQSRPRDSEQVEQRPIEAGVEREDERGVGSSGEGSADAEPAQVKKARQNVKTKSRWLSGKRPSSSVSNAESSVTPAVTRKLSSAKDNHVRAQAHKDKQQETTKSKSKYTLLLASEAAAAKNNDDAERPSTTSSAPSQPDEESASEERDSEKQEPPLEEPSQTTTTSTTTTQPFTSDCHERAEEEARANKATKEEEEEISFEAIASAISKTLSANEQPTEGKQPAESAEPTGDSASAANAAQEESLSSGFEEPASDSSEAELAPAMQKRRRTTGEHLAEVIDHLVDRRKQQHHDGSRFGDRGAFLNDQERSQHGPQIVVVAPVGRSGALLKARSLTKAEEPTNATTGSSAPIKAPASTKADSTKSSGFKKPVEALKKQSAEAKSPKAIGGRLIGVDPSADSPSKYSERVQVIEDDDSSSFLPAKSATASDQSALESEHVASIHVSSHSGEPRFRSPRHELSSSQMFERYAPIARSFNEQTTWRQPERPEGSAKNGEAKLYSAEQLIRNHILRSKANRNNRPAATHQQQQSQQQQQQAKEAIRPRQEEASSTQSPPVISTSTQSSIKARPPKSGEAPETQANRQQQQQQQQQQQPETMLQQQSQQQPRKLFSSSVQPVAVPAFYMRQSPVSPFRDGLQQRFNQPSEAFQVMESQQQQMRVEPSQGQHEYLREQQQQQQQQEQADSQQQLQSPQMQTQMQPQMQQYLPTFADQEIQVPAHMAESVIRDLQQSASSVTGMLHGQPMVFQALPPGQQPRLAPDFFQSPAQQSYHRFNSMMPQQQHQYQTAESQQRLQFLQPNRVQAESQLAPSSSPPSSSSSYSLNPFAIVSRLVGGRRHQVDQKRKEAQDRQVLANRDSAAKEQKQSAEEEKPVRSSRFIGTVKSFGPRSLVQPVAQLALKQVLSSIGQHAEALEQQAAAQQAEADAAEQAAGQQQLSPTQQQRSSAPPTGQQQQQQLAADAMQSSGSSPIGMAALPPPASQRDQLAAAASGRSMRSLPIGAQAPSSQQQVQTPAADQEVQESYGQMPAYHMPDHYGGGGGSGYHHPGGYGGAHYESPDKKSKGITFHFGGGPIGGGTQLITSPMGIFKHLMIPLTRSQTSLNGKLVFGVVLEKSTHVGVLPKKKHKYWGR